MLLRQLRKHLAIVGMLVISLVISLGVSLEAGVFTQIRWFDPDGIEGHLVIVGGGGFPDEIKAEFLKRAGGEAGVLVIIPTASESADRDTREQLIAPWKEDKFTEIHVLHTRDRDIADSDEFLKPLRSATAVWFNGGLQSKIADAYQGTAFERKLHALLARGGVVGGTSAGAAIMSRTMIASGLPIPEIKTGFDLLPGAIVDQHFTERQRLPRLLHAINEHPHLFGLGLDEGTGVIVDGRFLRILGTGHATVVFAGTDSEPAEQQAFPAGTLLDLTSLRRRAAERVLPEFPPHEPQPSRVANGSLVIVGGGGLPEEIVHKFIELAGGPDALIVILPTAVPADPSFNPQREAQFLKRAGAKRVEVLDARERAAVESPEFKQLIAQAGGLWFGGGRQWRFVDAYAGTDAEHWFHELLERGGVIGGSSAGASIQAEYLARGNPLGNLDIMAAGYERGLGFLPGVAVDQHFAQRNRFGDMTSLVTRHPQLLGIGIDEATALVVTGERGEILGRGQVHFFDRTPGKPDNYESLWSGLTYNLTERKSVPLVAPKPDSVVAP